MAEFTENLNLEMPAKTEQYNVAVQNSNMQKIDDFSKLIPARALTADKLTLAKKINGVSFDGTQNVITGLGLHSLEETYNIPNIVYGYIDEKIKLYKTKQDENIGHELTDTDWWEEIEISGGSGSGFNLGDIIITDHILEGEEALGKALQGTYVYKNGGTDRIGYPDFYNIYLQRKNESAPTEVNLGESTLTMYVHPNGHQFYNIADKAIVDTFYETYGIADFYGIDEENERIFLPRNKYFFQLTDDPAKVNEMMEAGLPNIEGKTGKVWVVGNEGNTTSSGALKLEYVTYNNTAKGSQTGMGNGEAYVSINASDLNPTYGNSDTVQPPSSLKLLYYCVGNTQVTSAVTNVTEITTSENDTLPWGYNFYSGDLLEAPVGYVESLGQWNRGQEWQSFYDRAVAKIGQPFADGYIKEHTETYDDYDLVINQDEMTFRLPLLNGKENIQTDEYVDLTFEATGTKYTAPSNGWYFLDKKGSAVGQHITIWNINKGYGEAETCQAVGVSCRILIWATKGDVLSVNYNLAGNTDYFRFFPAKGNGKLYFKLANAVQNLELLNVGEVMEAVADKISRQECKAYIVETYKNGASWYRIYSDGWCEQGGESPQPANTTQNTITLLKSYKDTNYTITSVGGLTSIINKANKTINSFTIDTNSGSGTKYLAYWQASGYIN